MDSIDPKKITALEKEFLKASYRDIKRYIMNMCKDQKTKQINLQILEYIEKLL
jgi:hypothetical protein